MEYERRLADLAAWEVGDGSTPSVAVEWHTPDSRQVYPFTGQTATMLLAVDEARQGLRQLERELKEFDDEGGGR